MKKFLTQKLILPFGIHAVLFSGVQAADLIEVYRQAQQHDATFAAAKAQLNAAKEQIPLAQSAFGIMGNANAQGSITDTANDGKGSVGSANISVSLSKALIDKSSSIAVQKAELGYQQAELSFQQSEQRLILDTAERYFRVLRQQDNLRFSTSEKEAIERQLDLAERRFEVGLSAVTDVKEAQASYDLAVANEISAENALNNALEQLRLSIGELPSSLASIQEEAPSPLPEPNDVGEWVTLAKQNNLQLRTQALSVEGSKLDIDSARATKKPTLSALANYTQNEVDDSMGDSRQASLQLRATWNFLNGGRVDAQVRQAKANQQSAAEQMRQTENSAEQETRANFLNVTSDISRIKALKQALISTQVAAEATQAGFDAGTRTAVEVLNSLRETYRAQANYVGARYDYLLNSLRLKSSAGTIEESDIETINSWLQGAQ